ncbi:clostripain family protein [gut metagenome]|uniref:Clostripain family protein n=1 Tax=gut metagenome TaxID=749906 RepID=J9GQE9_9ZZZZ
MVLENFLWMILRLRNRKIDFQYMMNKILFPLLVCCLLMQTACSHDDKIVMPVSVSKRTVLVYLAADNNLGGAGDVNFALKDVEEMKVGMGKFAGEGFHLLVYKDFNSGISAPELVEIKQNKYGKVVEKVVKTYEDRNSVGVAEMQEVFGDVFANPVFQAESYGLVFWSHGEGWFPYPIPNSRWIGQDVGMGDKRMNLSQFKEVLQSVPGLHFDFLMFDACFMQSVEVVYELRNFADYFVGSPAEIPGPGAPYDAIVPLMFVCQGAVDLAEAYYQVYKDIYNGGKDISNDNWTGGVSMSVTCSAALDKLAAVTRQCLQDVGEVSSMILKNELFDYDKRTKRDEHVGYYDWCQLMEKVLPTKSFDQWKKVFDESLVFWKTTPKNYSGFVGMFDMAGANGVTHYLPDDLSDGRVAAYRDLAWYEAAGLSQLGW